MSGSHLPDDYRPMADINVTPLVDVMLVLLVIFMVTAPLLESGIAVQLPKASAKALPKEENPVTLNITKYRTIFLGTDEVAPSELLSTLRRIFKQRSKKELYIRADESLNYGFVAATMAAAKQAGIHKIGLVTVPPEKGGGP